MVLVIFGAALWFVAWMPGDSFEGPIPAERRNPELEQRLRSHVTTLSRETGGRNFDNVSALRDAANYVERGFAALGHRVDSQVFDCWGEPVRNLEVELPGAEQPDRIVVIGAHYDSVWGSPGANDNASGIAVLLEIARILEGLRPGKTLRFVAFVNEEPPFFQTKLMGSLVYADRVAARNETIDGMISIETVGFFTHEPQSQRVPAIFGALYPDRGDFVAFVSNPESRPLLTRVIKSFRHVATLPSEGVAAPGFIPGVAWSDHWAFWVHGYRGVMVSDTALYRYEAYHTASDTPEKLDYASMAELTTGLAHAIRELVE